jgi:hypothetical protein
MRGTFREWSPLTTKPPMINPRPVVELTHEVDSYIFLSAHPRPRLGMTCLKRSLKKNYVCVAQKSYRVLPKFETGAQ